MVNITKNDQVHSLHKKISASLLEQKQTETAVESLGYIKVKYGI
jgi:hypothetical protein